MRLMNGLNQELTGRGTEKRNSFLVEYYTKINNGEIIVGHEIKKCLNKLIEDLGNEQFYYDTVEAELRIEFIETFCKHTKSPFYGKPFILELWEKALIEAFFSFRWTETRLKRFKKLILLIARKNGKSTFCAGLSVTELIVGNGGTDIICSSNDDAQASIIFDEINNMRERLDPHGKRTHKNLKGIYNLKNKSTIKKLSEKTRNKEGRNIDFAILDESHEMKDNVIAKSIEQSQSTKEEPIFINITTEGFVNDGYLDKELKYAREVLNDEREDYTLLPWLYTQDSELEIYTNPESWYKSNPSLGAIKKIDYLKDQLKKAQADKAERVFTLAKDFNIKQNNAEAWLMQEEIINNETFNIEDFSGCVYIGGVDLSESTDLAAAKIMLMRPGNNKKYIYSHYFIPEAKIEAGYEQDKKNYLEWAAKNYITVSPGNENDYSLISDWFAMLYRQYNIKGFMIGYDNWNAKYWIKEMENFGFDTEKVRQDYENLSNPMKMVEADLKSKLIVYNNNPIDKWCLENTAMKIDNLGRIMPVKVNDNRNRRIDGAVALIISYAIYNRYRTEYLEYVG